MTVMASKVNFVRVDAVVVNQESIILRDLVFCFVVFAKPISIGYNDS